MRRISIVIPTYWCRARGHAGMPQDAIFDHPTPVDEEGTLGRCLESLKELRGHSFRVLLITAPVNPGLAPEVEAKIQRLIEPFSGLYPIGQFAPSDLAAVRQSLQGKGLDPELVSLESYAQIRNCQILGSVLLDSDLIAAVDDDEVVPPDYLERAVRSVDRMEGRPEEGAAAGAAAEEGVAAGAAQAAAGPAGSGPAGLAGIYLDAAGDYRLKVSAEEAASTNRFIRKAALINAQFDSCLSSGRRLAETPLALGGNMVFPRRLFLEVSFDPGITRGEDIDYLINSRLFGGSWLMDTELSITHLPPKAAPGDPLTTTPYGKLQRDVLRFVYERRKIRISQERADLHPLSPNDFGIYPGELLGEELEEQALEALEKTRPPGADERFFPRPERVLGQARLRARQAGEYPAFNKAWKQLLEAVDSDGELKERMRRKLGL
jgi:hypothetical protein